jgi:hypothetical protein
VPPAHEATVVMGRDEFEDEQPSTLAPEDLSKLMIPPSSPRIGLDIDLDAPRSESGSLELEPLDFDTSAFDGDTEDPDMKR